jgi:hypothetical protein
MALRFSLKGLFATVAFAGLALTALLNANQWWSWGAVSLTLIVICYALLLALLRGCRAPFAVGFAAVGLVFLATISPPTGWVGDMFAFGGSRSPTTALLEAICPFKRYDNRSDDNTTPETSANTSPPAVTQTEPDALDDSFVEVEGETEEPGAAADSLSTSDPFPTKLNLVISGGSQPTPESPDAFRIDPFVEIGSCLFVLLFAALGGLAAQAIVKRVPSAARKPLRKRRARTPTNRASAL